MTADFAIIFDMDGVIVDSNPYHKVALKQFVRKYGRDLTDQELLQKVYGRTNKEWLTNLFGVLSTEQLHRYTEEKEELYRALFKNEIRPLKGLVTFLEALEQYHIPRAIATSAPHSNVTFTLDGTGTRNYFKVILDDTFVTHGKPNPEIYVKAAAALHMPPAQCIVFEDSLSGVQSGQAAGARVVGVTTTHSPEELAHTNYVINDFADLDPLLLFRKIFAK